MASNRPSLYRSEVGYPSPTVGRFTVGSKLVFDCKNSDGKDQHDQQHSDNGRVKSILEFQILGVEVSKHFTTKVVKSRSDEITR
jgi:hypothetical protein